MKPVNILHIMTRLPVGGVENQLLLVLKNYDRNRFNPMVCSLSDKGEIGAEIEKAGFPVVCLGSLSNRFKWSTVTGLVELMRRRDIHVVRTHQYHANLYGRIAAFAVKVPCVVASVHNVYTRDNKLHRRIINRILASVSDRVVAVSEAVKADIMKYDGIPREKITVVYNGFDPERFRSADGAMIRREFGIPPEAKVLGIIGRLSEQKGHIYGLEAFGALKRDFRDAVLLVVGDGPLREKLREEIEKLGVSRSVIFTGTRRDIADLLDAMDIFLFPSLWEGLPNALLEAMAAGKPVVASAIAPVKEIISSDRLGLLAPTADSSAIADAAARLLSDEKLAAAVGAAAKEKAVSELGIGRTVATYEKMFLEILGAKGWKM